MMEPIASKFADIVRLCSLKSPQLPWISSLTGALISDREATDPDYWAQQLRQPVRFTDGIRQLLIRPPCCSRSGQGKRLGPSPGNTSAASLSRY